MIPAALLSAGFLLAVLTTLRRNTDLRSFFFWGAGYLSLISVSGFLLLYRPEYAGMPSRWIADAANHLSYRIWFETLTPNVYHGFVTFYSVVWWWQTLFDLTYFEAFRLSFYLMIPVLAGFVAATATLALPDRGFRTGLIFFGWLCLVSWAAMRYTIFPLWHFNQTNGFYSHFMALIPLLTAWLLYAVLEKPWQRALTFALCIIILRYSYGLNLGDFILTGMALLLVEKGSFPPSWQRWLNGILLLAGILAVAVFVNLYPLSKSRYILEFPNYDYVYPATFLLALCLGIVPLWLERRGRPLSASFIRLNRFALFFVLANFTVILLYRLAGLRTEAYYFRKYSLHSIVLLLIMATVMAAGLLTDATRDWRLARLKIKIPVLTAGLVMACLIAVMGQGHRTFRKKSFFLNRITPAATAGELRPLYNEEVDRWIHNTLTSKKARFGGYISPVYPEFHFMNAVHSLIPQHLEPTHLWRDQLQIKPAINPTPGYCTFWSEFEDEGRGVKETYAFIRAQRQNPHRVCRPRRTNLAGSSGQEICYQCNPPAGEETL